MPNYYGPKIATDGLVLYLDAANNKSYSGNALTLGEIWKDLSGNNNSGSFSAVLNAGPAFNTANGGSIVFDGFDDFSNINNPETFRNQNFSVSLWISPNTQLSNIVSVLDFNHAASPSQGWVLQTEDAGNGRNFYLAWHDGTQFQPVGGFGPGLGIQLSFFTWQNIVYSKSGTSLLGYLNGVQVYNRTGTNSNVNYASGKNFRIGHCLDVPSRWFKGNIAQVSIYNRALSPSEILENYNATKTRFGL